MLFAWDKNHLRDNCFHSFHSTWKPGKAFERVVLQGEGMVSSLLHVEAAGFCSSLLHSHATPDLTTPVANFSAQKCPNYP